MKKNILQLIYLPEKICIEHKNDEEFVYRHFSNLSPKVMDKMTKMYNISLPQLLIGTFAILMRHYFHDDSFFIYSSFNDIEIVTIKVNVEEDLTFTDWIGSIADSHLFFQDTILADSASHRFEIKLIRQKILYSFYYQENEFYEIIKKTITKNFEKIIKQLIREPHRRIRDIQL